jgi:leucyl-tRNA synthetase
MDKEAFIKAMKEAPDELDTEWFVEVIFDNIKASRDNEFACPDQRQLHIAIEEMSELTKELTKALRGKGDRDAILEEYADVWIILHTLGQIFDFDYDEIEAAMYVKLKRIEDKLKSDGVYQ